LPQDSAAQKQDPVTRPARRRRGGTGSADRSKATETAVSEKEVTAGAPKASSGRSRRGRRGGSARKTAREKTEAPVEAAEPLATTPVRTNGGALEALLTQQETILHEFSESQATAMKGVQGSLSAIENRLAGISRATTEGPRVGIFVDVPNVMYAAERQRVTLDFKKMLDFIVRDRELVRASAYAPISDDPKEKLDTQKFVHPFVGLGYRMVIKPLKRYADGSMKANFDVELAIDVLTMSDRLDIVTLVSGDGDFRRLVELVASKGVRVEVVAFGESTAAELRAVADEYTDLNDHLSELRAK
jgi:uncharacterized LabA/DUF88 family protein